MWFSPIIPRTAEAIFEANRVFAAAAKDLGIPQLRFALPAWYWERAVDFHLRLSCKQIKRPIRSTWEAFYKVIDLAADMAGASTERARRFRMRS